jgi:hypothetical protein
MIIILFSIITQLLNAECGLTNKMVEDALRKQEETCLMNNKMDREEYIKWRNIDQGDLRFRMEQMINLTSEFRMNKLMTDHLWTNFIRIDEELKRQNDTNTWMKIFANWNKI